jgi:hypothetical protein
VSGDDAAPRELPEHVREKIVRAVTPMLRATDEFAAVRVTIRCAKCGRIASRSTLTFDDLRGRLDCKVHGPIAPDLTVADLHAEWTRRNKPESFTIKRNPLH